MFLPSELSAGNNSVVVRERFVVDGGLDFGQQAADTTALARSSCVVVMKAASASRVPGTRAFGDHGDD